jgi:hypothetical protein
MNGSPHVGKKFKQLSAISFQPSARTERDNQVSDPSFAEG